MCFSLVELSRPVLVIGVHEHLQGVVFNVGVSYHLLSDGVIITQLLLHLENTKTFTQKKLIGRQSQVKKFFSVRLTCRSFHCERHKIRKNEELKKNVKKCTKELQSQSVSKCPNSQNDFILK